MTGWIHITSLDDPRVGDYRDQKDAWLRVQADADAPATGLPGGRFMAEGELVVASLLHSRHRARSILGTPHRLEALVQRAGPISHGIPVYVAEQDLMNQIAGFPIHRGLLSCGQAAPMPTLDQLLADTRTLVVLEDLSNHDNVGGIFRNVAALGGAFLDSAVGFHGLTFRYTGGAGKMPINPSSRGPRSTGSKEREEGWTLSPIGG